MSKEQTDLSVQQLGAVILENEDEIGGEIDLCTTLQKETFRDVEIYLRVRDRKSWIFWRSSKMCLQTFQR